MPRVRRRSWRDALPLAPALLLSLVAAAQVGLTRTVHLTPWKGGGFGMFSTTDEGLRPLRIRVRTPSGERAVSVPPGLRTLARRAAVLPSDRHLEALGRAMAREERASGRAVSAVRIEVWRPDYDARTLAPRLELLAERTVDVAGRPPAGP